MRVRINDNRKADLSFSLQRNISWQRVTDATKKVCCLCLQGSRCSISWNSSALNVDAATPPNRRYLSTNTTSCPRWRVFKNRVERKGGGEPGQLSSYNHVTRRTTGESTPDSRQEQDFFICFTVSRSNLGVHTASSQSYTGLSRG
jgi:hypothetical protein